MDVRVVGSGPNGLAAAVLLARAGAAVTVYEAAGTVGGGARTSELTLPGFLHDTCSAVHPMALASPFFRAFDLASKGVEMLVPDISYAHPLDGGRAGVAWRDLDRTVAQLGADGEAWRRLLGPLTRRWSAVTAMALSDLRRPPADLRAALRFSMRVIEQGSPAWNLRFAGEVAAAMVTGVAAHTVAPPRGPAPAGAGLLLATLAHTVGWPVPRGGSQVISDALAADLLRHGGTVKLRHRVDDLADVLPADAVLVDSGPAELLRIAGRRLPDRYARALARFRYGSAACKVDFALAGPVPWANPDCRQAGTLHVVGTRPEAVEAERRVADGHHVERPYVLVAQPGVVDPGRAPAGRHTLWSYAHVPHGSPVDVSAAVTAQIERFAPGFRDLILDRHVVPAAQQQDRNANAVGGDITGGAVNLWQTVMRPVARWDPYRTPLPGVYLCSASTPPGPGVHGMAGLHAARRVLRRMRPDADVQALLAAD